MNTLALCLALAGLASCGSPTPRPVTTPTHEATPSPPDAAPDVPAVNVDIDSKDILQRPAETGEVLVKHVLVAWKDLAAEYNGRLDPRAQQRTQQDAAKLAVSIADSLRAAPGDIDAMIDKHGEDPGALSHEPYSVKPTEPFVVEFKALSLRLAMNEVGIVRTVFGYHVIVRVAPPPPDPLQSNDILARTAKASTVDILYVIVGWTEATTQAATRTKAEADALAKKVLDEARAGADMAKLAKQHSDDASVNSGKPFEITDRDTSTPIQELALRLQVGEAGMIRSKVGWIVMKRMPPPPPDPLESKAILARTTAADTVQVKHILLGWKENGGGDERAEKRTRKELEKLVKATVGKLKKKGAKIEPMMAELSEDPGSAKTGEAYTVTPDTPFVDAFKRLALRLKVGEVGVVKTHFGIHIIQRVE